MLVIFDAVNVCYLYTIIMLIYLKQPLHALGYTFVTYRLKISTPGFSYNLSHLFLHYFPLSFL